MAMRHLLVVKVALAVQEQGKEHHYMTFENCYIVLSRCNGTCSHYSDEFTCNENDLLLHIREFIEKNLNDFAEDVYVYVDNEDGYFEYKTKLRNDIINNHIDDVMNSIERQMKKYIDENTMKEIQQ